MIVYECSQFLAGLMISSWMPNTVNFILLCAGQRCALIISLSFSLTCNCFSIVWGFEACFFFNLFYLFYIYLFYDCVSVHAMVIIWMSERQLMRADSLLPSWGFWGLVPKYYRTPSIWALGILALFVPIIGQRLFYWFLSSVIFCRWLTHTCADPSSVQNSVRLSEAHLSSSVSSFSCHFWQLWFF